MVKQRSAFWRGWDRAKSRYPETPRTQEISAMECQPPARFRLNDIERESFVDGYRAWCGGTYHRKQTSQ